MSSQSEKLIFKGCGWVKTGIYFNQYCIFPLSLLSWPISNFIFSGYIFSLSSSNFNIVSLALQKNLLNLSSRSNAFIFLKASLAFL
jgi:hypothetical protein